MSGNLGNLECDPRLMGAAALIHCGYPQTAIEMLEGCGVDKERIERIREMIPAIGVNSTGTQNRLEVMEIKDRMVVVLNTEAPQLLPVADLFNPYKDKLFEFGGKFYKGITHCFCAQMYRDQPDLMDCCAEIDDLERLEAFVQLNPMTSNHKRAWDNPADVHKSQRGVLMHVCRAQFGQNPELGKNLLATGKFYLGCHKFPFVFTENLLGECLMDLRGEYGGAGRVAQSVQLTFDIWSNILGSGIGIPELGKLSCLNKSFYEWVSKGISMLPLESLIQICGNKLHVIDTSEGRIPFFLPNDRKLEFLKKFQKLVCLVEGDEGVAWITLEKGRTLNQCIKTAKDKAITVSVRFAAHLVEQIGGIPVEQAYGELISCNILKGSRGQSISFKEKLLKEKGFEMPGILDYVTLCAYMQIILRKYVYCRDKNGSPSTYGVFAECKQLSDLCPAVGVGASSPFKFQINGRLPHRDVGVGARWKF